MNDSDVCCGFGGTFCIKYSDISGRLVDEKVENADATDASIVLGGDVGCLMNIAGRLRRQGKDTRVFHVTEFLAGRTDGGGIAGPEEGEP